MMATFKTIEKGSLVYIPSSVELYNYDGSRVSKAITTVEPMNCLVVSVDDSQPRKRLSVLYKGATWVVDMNDVYGIANKNKREEYVGYIG